jgi:Zn-finger nucleic acid-binding protein
MNCPKGSAAMEIVGFDGIEVDRCTGCLGLWFDGAPFLYSLQGST